MFPFNIFFFKFQTFLFDQHHLCTWAKLKKNNVQTGNCAKVCTRRYVFNFVPCRSKLITLPFVTHRILFRLCWHLVNSCQDLFKIKHYLHLENENEDEVNEIFLIKVYLAQTDWLIDCLFLSVQTFAFLSQGAVLKSQDFVHKAFFIYNKALFALWRIMEFGVS